MLRNIVTGTKDTEELFVINRIVIKVMTAFSLLLLLGYAVEVLQKGYPVRYAAVLSAIILISLAVDYVFYFRNKNAVKNRYVFLASFFVPYAAVLFTSTTHLSFLYLIPVLFILLLYGDRKLIYLSCTAYVLSGFSEIAYKAYVLHLTEQSDIRGYAIEAAGILFISYCAIKAVSASQYFSGKLKESIQEEARTPEDTRTPGSILKDTSDMVFSDKSDSDERPEIVDVVDFSGETSDEKRNEFIIDTTENEEQIQEQPLMSSVIQDSAHDTEETSFSMIQTAEDSDNEPINRVAVTHEPDEPFSLTELINTDIISAMTSLQDKISEFSDIASIISDITNQTNLLVINAFIENTKDLSGFEEVKNTLTANSQAASDLLNKNTLSSSDINELTGNLLETVNKLDKYFTNRQ